MDRKNLIVFTGPPKAERLAERARIVAKNFSDPDIGLQLIDFMLLSVYNEFASEDDFYSEQICAKMLEARSYIAIFQGEYDENDKKPSDPDN